MRSCFEGVIATDQSKRVTTLGPTSALWRCTRPTPSALSRSSATKCDQPVFFLVFPTAADRDPRVRTGFSHAYSLPGRADDASTRPVFHSQGALRDRRTKSSCSSLSATVRSTFSTTPHFFNRSHKGPVRILLFFSHTQALQQTWS